MERRGAKMWRFVTERTWWGACVQNVNVCESLWDEPFHLPPKLNYSAPHTHTHTPTHTYTQVTNTLSGINTVNNTVPLVALKILGWYEVDIGADVVSDQCFQATRRSSCHFSKAMLNLKKPLKSLMTHPKSHQVLTSNRPRSYTFPEGFQWSCSARSQESYNNLWFLILGAIPDRPDHPKTWSR